jgi:hypothetical protein
MQTEKTIEVNGAIRAAAARLWNRNGRAQAIVILFAEWNDNVETVDSAALKQNDKFFFPEAGVAAMARCRNVGMVLRPTMAMPPCFMK